MLLDLAITLWLLVALPSAVFLWRYGYAGIEVPVILVSPFQCAPKGFRWVTFLLSQFPANYFLANLFLVYAVWRSVGWGLAAGIFLASSFVFTWVHNSAQKRAARELYNWMISE